MWLVNRSKVRLRNITDTSTTLVGTSEYASTAGADQTQPRSWVNGQFTIATSKTFELQQFFQTAKATNGFGVETNSGEIEVYAVVELWKIS
jgi:hypothetical protein